MNKLQHILCLGIIIILGLLGCIPSALAAGPDGVTSGLAGVQPVPPRPDLMAQLMAAGPGRPGFTLDPALNSEAAAAAYRQYLATKLDPALRGDQALRNASAGRQLAGAPSVDQLLVALVEFSDMRHNAIPQPGVQNNTDYWVQNFDLTHYNTLLFNTSPGTKSLANYYRDASYNALTLNGVIHDWVTMPGLAANYGNDGISGVDMHTVPPTDTLTLTDLVQDAADVIGSDAAWAGAIHWADYCSSANVIDYFVVVHAGKGQEAGGGSLGDNAIWSTTGSLDAPYPLGRTGYYVQDFIVVAEDVPVGVLAHEFAHLFGLPDTWNPDVDDIPWPDWDQGGMWGEPSPACYDLLSYGCWLGRPLGTQPASMTAWARIELGWLSPAVWDLSMDPASIFLAELETPSPNDKALKILLPSFARSGSAVRRAPDPADTTSPSTLTREFYLDAETSAELRFYHWYDLESGHDYAYVEVMPSGASTWTTLRTFTGSSGEVWTQEIIDLSAYRGTTVNVRFRLTRDASYEGQGWFLDDFSLWEDGEQTWSDNCEIRGLRTAQAAPTRVSSWSATRFPLIEAVPYYLAEWRNDQAGFDVGLGQVYNMANAATGLADYFRYNPGLLLWYVNPRYLPGDNNVFVHPGAGFMLAVDAHPDPDYQTSAGTAWRTRVQMQDATFRASAQTYTNTLREADGTWNTIGPKAAVSTFRDYGTANPYWRAAIPHNSAKTPTYGITLEVEGERADRSGATVRFYLDAANLETSTKTVDKAQAEPGQVLTYTIVLTNTGVADAYTVVVSDTAPAHTSYIPSSYTVAGSPSWTMDEPGNAGIYWRGVVPLNTPVTITYQCALDTAINNGTVVENVASIYEGKTLETKLSAKTTVVAAPHLETSVKVSTPDSVLAGDFITYTIALTNSGTMAGTVYVTDCIPIYTTYVADSLQASDGVAVYDAESNCIHWSGYLPVEVGPSALITFQVQVQPGAVTPDVFNVAEVDNGMGTVIQLTDTTTVRAAPNLRASAKTVDKDVAKPGDTLRYAITLSNLGNVRTTLLLTDTIPAHTSLVTGTLDATVGEAELSGGAVSWAGSLAPTALVTITFDVTIETPLASGTPITNTAQVLEDGVTLHELKASTLVLSEPLLTRSTKEWESNSLGAGGTLTYTITLVNGGTVTGNVSVSDRLPAGLAYQSGPTASSGTGAYNPAHNEITWTGLVTPGLNVEIAFAVTITLTGTETITNVAWIDDGFHEAFPITATTRVAGLVVDAPEEAYYCGDLISVPVRIVNVQDLQGFQLNLTFDPTILQVESIDDGDWFTPAAWIGKDYDNEAGTISLYSALRNQAHGLSGDGDLFTLNFRAVGDGISNITIQPDSRLSNTPSPSFSPIPHNRVSGHLTVYGRLVSGHILLDGRIWGTEQYDGVQLMAGDTVLAVTDVSGYYSFCPPVGTGESFVLTARKQGYLYAQGTLTVNFTGTVVLPTVTLSGGDVIGVTSETITSPGAPTCPASVTVERAGPPDGRVYINDLAFVGANFDKRSSDADWGPDPCHPDYVAYKADINEDGVVDILDLTLVGYNFNREGPLPWF